MWKRGFIFLHMYTQKNEERPRESSTVYQSALHREICFQRMSQFKSEVMISSRKAHIIHDHSGQVEETLVNTVKPQQSQAGLRVRAAITAQSDQSSADTCLSQPSMTISTCLH